MAFIQISNLANTEASFLTDLQTEAATQIIGGSSKEGKYGYGGKEKEGKEKEKEGKYGHGHGNKYGCGCYYGDDD
jgi:hypothetical protein